MNCPKCKSKKSKIFYTNYKPVIRNRKGDIIGTSPQFYCLNCGAKWDIVTK